MQAWLVQYGLGSFEEYFTQQSIDAPELLLVLTNDEKTECWRRGRLKLGHVLKIDRLLSSTHCLTPMTHEQRITAEMSLKNLLERHGLSMYIVAMLEGGFDEDLLRDLNQEEIGRVIADLDIQLFGHIARFRKLLNELRNETPSPTSTSTTPISISQVSAVSLHVPQSAEEKGKMAEPLQISPDLMELLKDQGLEAQKDAMVNAGIVSLDIVRQLGEQAVLARLSLKLGPKVKMTKLLATVFAPASSTLPQQVHGIKLPPFHPQIPSPCPSQPSPSASQPSQPSPSTSQPSQPSPSASQPSPSASQSGRSPSPAQENEAMNDPPQDNGEEPQDHAEEDVTAQDFAGMCEDESGESLPKLKALLARNPEWAHPGENGLAPLFLVSTEDTARALLEAKADPNPRDSKNNTPLVDLIMFTAAADVDDAHYKLIECLLHFGADPNVSPSLLGKAVQHRDAALMLLLLQHHARASQEVRSLCQQSFPEGLRLLQSFNQ